jgi:hypothetical protein
MVSGYYHPKRLKWVASVLELLDELGQPPGSDNLDGGVAGLPGQLEADLVVL